MASQTLTLAAAGQSNWGLINLNAFRGGVGLISVFQTNGVANATAAWSVLVCGQDPKNTGILYGSIYGLHDTLKGLAATSAQPFTNFNSSLAYPCTGLALLVTQLTAGASVSLSIVQVVN